MKVRVRRYRSEMWRDTDTVESCPKGSPLYNMMTGPGVIRITVLYRSGDETSYSRLEEELD